MHPEIGTRLHRFYTIGGKSLGFYDILNMWFNPLSNMFIPALVLIATGYFFTKVLETKKSRLIGGGAMIFAFVLSAILLPFAQNYANAFMSLFIGGAAAALFIGFAINNIARWAINFFTRHPVDVGSDGIARARAFTKPAESENSENGSGKSGDDGEESEAAGNDSDKSGENPTHDA